jgi:mono/diheme cytochrome c family protein
VRRSAVIALGLLAAGVLAACGAQGVASPTPVQCNPSCVATDQFPIVAAFHLTGNPTKGASIFASQGCGGCHTLAAAGSTGTVGPDLDQLKPPYRDATAQVTNGGVGMQAFGKSGALTTQEVADVAAYVVKSTGGTVP